jgi:hypothetical protein
MRWGVKHNFSKLKNVEDDLKAMVKSSMGKLATEVKTELVDSVESGDTAWPPLSETTRFLTNRDRPMVGTGDFVRSIRTEVTGDKASIGILIPKGEKGQDMEAMARVAEGGAYVRVTEKMRKWFAAKGRPLRKTTSVIYVPPRPVFNPKTEFVEDKIDEIFGNVLNNLVEKL